MTGPARITIELQPPAADNGAWVTRTHVEDASTGLTAPATLPIVGAPREPGVVPPAYEPQVDCSCIDGLCDLDHDNE